MSKVLGLIVTVDESEMTALDLKTTQATVTVLPFKPQYPHTNSPHWTPYNHFMNCLKSLIKIACEQALRGGKTKESLQLRLWNLNIGIEKVESKSWLAEMTLVMTSLPLARVFQCLFTFALVSASRWLAEIWQLSRKGATGELEVEFKFQRRRRKLSFLFPPHRQSAPESLLAG